MPSEYVDIRELMDGYKTVPCRECGCDIYVTTDFHPDDWWCRAHTPRTLNVDHLFDDAVVPNVN